MTSSEVNAANAYRYSDNYSIVRSSDGSHYGCEHNESEANAIAKYLTSHHGQFFHVVKNSPDVVRAAKAIRGTEDVVRVKHREMILKSMGAW